MKVSAAAIASLSILLSACANYGSFLGQPDDHASIAREAISSGDSAKANAEIDYAIGNPEGDAKIRELFVKFPQAKIIYRTYLEQLIADVKQFYQAESMFHKLKPVKAAGIYSLDQTRDLDTRLSKVVAEANLAGTLNVDLSDSVDDFPILKTSKHRKIIADRSIEKLEHDGARPGLVAGLMAYVRQIGVESEEGKRIESLLPKMKIRADELDVVAKLYPQFSAARREAITVRVFVQFKNADRLVSDDFVQAFRMRIRGVQWMPSPDPKTTTLLIDRVRNDEKTLSERSQTITYAQSDVNFLSAALLMPRNASYLFDLVSSGAEIEYGYVVSASLDGKTIHDEVVRGKVGGESHKCQNARIQNVFGGISPAGFVANDDMQRRCSGSSAVSIDELRREVLSKVVEAVLRVPTIKAAQELN